MSATIINRIKQFLKTLESLQDATLSLFESKRAAVTTANSAEMIRLADAEAELTMKMKFVLGTRREILLDAKRSGIASTSIYDIVAASDDSEREALSKRIQTARKKSERIRRESWVQWVVSQRATTYYNELLELIAYSGKKSPVYNHKQESPVGGGSILDASA